MSTRSTIYEWDEYENERWSFNASFYADIDGDIYLEYETLGVTVDIELPPSALKALAAWLAMNPVKE